MKLNIAGHGPPVVLIHGVAGRAAQWDRVTQLLAANHTVIAPDLLGHGEFRRGDVLESQAARLPGAAKW